MPDSPDEDHSTYDEVEATLGGKSRTSDLRREPPWWKSRTAKLLMMGSGLITVAVVSLAILLKSILTPYVEIEDPEQVAQLLRSMVQIDIPNDFKPSYGAQGRGRLKRFKGCFFEKSTGGSIALFVLPSSSTQAELDEMTLRLGSKDESSVEHSEHREIVIDDQLRTALFERHSFVDEDGQSQHQWIIHCSLMLGGDVVTFLGHFPVEDYDESEVYSILQSILPVP